ADRDRGRGYGSAWTWRTDAATRTRSGQRLSLSSNSSCCSLANQRARGLLCWERATPVAPHVDRALPARLMIMTMSAQDARGPEDTPGGSPRESTAVWTGRRPMASRFSPQSPRIHRFCPARKTPLPSSRPSEASGGTFFLRFAANRGEKVPPLASLGRDDGGCILLQNCP